MVDNEVSKAFVETRMGSSPISCTIWHRSSVEQNASLSRQRARVQVPSVSPCVLLNLRNDLCYFFLRDLPHFLRCWVSLKTTHHMGLQLNGRASDLQSEGWDIVIPQIHQSPSMTISDFVRKLVSAECRKLVKHGVTAAPRLMVQILPAIRQQKSRMVKALQQDVRRTMNTGHTGRTVLGRTENCPLNMGRQSVIGIAPDCKSGSPGHCRFKSYPAHHQDARIIG